MAKTINHSVKNKLDKITRVALMKAGGLDAEQCDILMEIFYATGNPELCTEMYLGIYEEPILPPTAGKYTMTSFDKFRDEVRYTWKKVKRVHVNGEWIDSPEGELVEDWSSMSSMGWIEEHKKNIA